MLAAGGTFALLQGCGAGDTTTSSAGTGTGTGTGSSGSTAGSGTTTGSGSVTSCVTASTETNGPYPSDGSNSVNGAVSNVLLQNGVVRSDIRSSFNLSSNTAAGVPLTLTLTLVNSNSSCALLTGWAVYIWHCTREGGYSLYSGGIQGEDYLRGVQATDANGQLTFTTVFPGCYSGRYPHIHFEVFRTLADATGRASSILISQMALPADVCNTVYANATGYSASRSNFAATSIANDNVFADNTAAQITAQTPTLAGSVANGYTGSIIVGVPF
jgi:protocatechuate 3,4-dioxygenase beta subunit